MRLRCKIFGHRWVKRMHIREWKQPRGPVKYLERIDIWCHRCGAPFLGTFPRKKDSWDFQFYADRGKYTAPWKERE